jgi:hypothetical protein
VTPCPAPLGDDVLLDWWSGELSRAARRRVEEHLLSCAACAARAEATARLVLGARELVRRGEVPAVLLPPVVERLRREGRRVREYRVAPGGSVRCTVAPDDDVVLSRLSADLRGVARVDLVSRIDEGAEHRLSDLPFDAAAGELVYAPPAAALRARPAGVERLRLVAVGPEKERVLGEYTFDHTPWPGAPGAS